MKRKYYILSLAWMVATSLFTSCGKEADPVFDFSDPRDGFLPADSATDEISQIRREFYQENGTFLLFSDTLTHQFIGKDINGDNRYKTELLDIKYEVGQTNTATYKPTYSYLNTTEKCRNAVAYLKAFILPHLSPKLMPFSWFLAGNIYDTTTSGTATRPYALAGQRCIALACSQLASLKTDAQKQQLANRHLLIIVQNLANNNAPAFNSFCAVCASYYGTDMTVPTGQTTQTYLRGLGFLNSTQASTFPSQSDDINAYTTLVITYSDAQIESIYGSYPLIISKAKMFRESLESLGYIY